MAFLIPGAGFDAETGILWRREMIGHAYRPVMLPVQTVFGAVQALTFVADHSAAVIQPDLPRHQQARLLATGVGVLGSSLDYIETRVAQLEALGIGDADVAGLLAEARALAAGVNGSV